VRYRFAIDRWDYELLGGLVKDGEEPAETARREVVEDSGWRPTGEPDHLGGGSSRCRDGAGAG
jgi:ADP-ribose pyrophosphatase YjhB (NUDIX family)